MGSRQALSLAKASLNTGTCVSASPSRIAIERRADALREARPKVTSFGSEARSGGSQSEHGSSV